MLKINLGLKPATVSVVISNKPCKMVKWLILTGLKMDLEITTSKFAIGGTDSDYQSLV